MRARELMSIPVVTVSPEASLKKVAERMVAHRVSGVPVVDHSGRLVGIISESDLVSKLEYEEKGQGLVGLLDQLAHAVGADRKLHARTAAELMTSGVVTGRPDASVRELIHLMTSHGVNRIPIVESGRVIGIVTRADLLRTLVRPDTAITEDVRYRLLHDLWIDPTGLVISTRDGIVTMPVRWRRALRRSWSNIGPRPRKVWSTSTRGASATGRTTGASRCPPAAGGKIDHDADGESGGGPIRPGFVRC